MSKYQSSPTINLLLIVLFASILHSSASRMAKFILTNNQIKDLDFDTNNSMWYNNFDERCQCVFIIPGWKNSAFDQIFKDIADEYNANAMKCFNTVRVEWPDSMQEIYANAAHMIRKVAEELATFIRRLQKMGLIQNTELVGFSLGAHLAGLVGRTLIQYLGQNDLITEIIALDPAGPGFTDLFFPFAPNKLQPTDAKHVVTLTTNSGCTGSSERLGSVNFIANNGRNQAGCARSDCLCSHHKALEYFLESITSNKFVGTSLDYEHQAVFGRGKNEGTPPGDYYFYTNACLPYAQGG